MHASPIQSTISDMSVAFSTSKPHSEWLEEKEIANTRRIVSILGTRRPYGRASEPPAGRDRYMSGTPLIAVVDDEPVIAITLAEILSRHGFVVVWFTDPAKTLQFARCCEISLLVSDVNMPELDGITLAEGIRCLRPDCAIVLLSAKSFEDEIRQRILSIGSEIHLEAKPVRIEQLLSTIRTLIARRSMGRPCAQTNSLSQ
jgi:CheY-like chemotaxis protein